MTETETTELAFDVDAALLVELGERLVARRSAALAELIKNAYDADATEVIISFKHVADTAGADSASEIVVVDDGSGMTLAAMMRGWMRIATTDAAVNSKSPRFGRPRTGAKGVGRFACGRLASRLALESVAHIADRAERIVANFDWHDFQAGKDLSDIRARISREFPGRKIPTGTTLRLSGLSDIWTEKDIAALQAELDSLVNLDEHAGSRQRAPNAEADPGFHVEILAPEFPKFEGAVGERFMESAWGVLRGQVDSDGVANYELRVRDSERVLRHRAPNRVFDSLIDATFVIRMMIYQGSSFRGSGYNLAEARQLGRERGGVRVYLDGFQIYSYGSPGNDWLDLDQDRARRTVALPDWLKDEASDISRPMLALPGNMQLFGSVAISRESNPDLTVALSRERLVQNDSYAQLKMFVRSGIDWMTVCYARDKAARSSATKTDQRAAPTATQTLRSVQGTIATDRTLPEPAKKTILAALDKVAGQIDKESEEHVSELSMLRILASAGTAVLIFDHSLRAMAGQLQGIVDRLVAVLDHYAAVQHPEAEQAIQDLRSWSSMATGQGELVGLLVGVEARTRRRTLALRPVVESLVRAFAAYTERFGIKLENEVPATVRTPAMYEAELYAIIVNLLTNSFKAVRTGPQRRVRIDALGSAQHIVIRVHDTGGGIPDDVRDQMFEPFVTTSQPDPVLGVGTGLGLKIVHDLAVAWGGDARFVDASPPWATTIEIMIPKG